MTRSGRLLLSVIGAFAIATAGVTGAAAAPLEPSANLPAAGVITPDAAPANRGLMLRMATVVRGAKMKP